MDLRLALTLTVLLFTLKVETAAQYSVFTALIPVLIWIFFLISKVLYQMSRREVGAHVNSESKFNERMKEKAREQESKTDN